MKMLEMASEITAFRDESKMLSSWAGVMLEGTDGFADTESDGESADGRNLGGVVSTGGSAGVGGFSGVSSGTFRLYVVGGGTCGSSIAYSKTCDGLSAARAARRSLAVGCAAR